MAIGLLAACGGGSDGGSGAGPAQGPPETQLSVPSLYDTSRGWETDLRGTQLTLPYSKAVAVFGDSRFTVLDVTNGSTLWKSAPIELMGSTKVLSLSLQGKDYLAVASSGTKGADTVNKGRELTTLDIFPASGSGEAVKPAHHVELDGKPVITDGGGGLLAEMDDDDMAMTVDPATGKTEKYHLDELKPPAEACKLCLGKTKVVAVTSRGPLLRRDAGTGRGHYWVPGVWWGGSLTTGPDNQVFAHLVAEDALAVKWHDKGGTGATWAVVDSATGRVRAEVDCQSREMGGTDGDDAALSAGGRYLVRGHTVFDLEKGTGRCFAETDQRNPVRLTGVTEDGVAFGAASEGVTSTPVVIDIATGKVEDSEHAVVPFGDYAGHGVFWDESSETMVVYPHAE